MIAKELRDIGWMFVISAVLILLPALSVTSYEKEIRELTEGQTFTDTTGTLDESGAVSSAPPPDSVHKIVSDV